MQLQSPVFVLLKRNAITRNGSCISAKGLATRWDAQCLGNGLGNDGLS